MVKREARGEVFFGASRRVRGREARRGLQHGDVRIYLRRAPVGEDAEAHDLQPGDVFRVSAWVEAWWPVALSTSGGLGRYWVLGSQLSGICLARAVGSASGGAAQSASMLIKESPLDTSSSLNPPPPLSLSSLTSSFASVAL